MAKKRMVIYGTLVYPLSIGGVAFIKEADKSRRTSAVKHYIKLPSGTVHIVTKNTRYVLYPLTKAKAAAREVRS